MSVSDLKTKIIEKISAITEESILEEISRFVSEEVKMEAVYKLNSLEREAVEKGLDDMKKGRVYTSEEAENMIQKWLNKR